jgi:hypothetical protein
MRRGATALLLTGKEVIVRTAFDELRGEFFDILTEGLSTEERSWVIDRIAYYQAVNAETGERARL